VSDWVGVMREDVLARLAEAGDALEVATQRYLWVVARAAGGPPGRMDETPEQILKRRYARGEIEREYQRRLDDLRR
jgi:hypothetical protein